jgi:hypothetical protein
MAATDADRARGELRDLFRIEPDIVRQLIDGSLEEARKMLRLIEPTTGFSGEVNGAGL